ncbi:sensor histidine kinase [Aureimonas jatrophae]|uniref:Blue-light-activated histidine kinase n=1 Tax=Aureimonas jatrophae TaxID=1166073 RepID=A0A1H0KSY0_9HYPH|nr:HWE histidine kinase domain-containing protein [Aureimonas jatrophae]MBB3948854.1 PAS domain S-box-containing protein [Aureimonas jatrophae]SDO58881.1 PAS domain S-box-containing protein [Aureimonas jatrophae]
MPLSGAYHRSLIKALSARLPAPATYALVALAVALVAMVRGAFVTDLLPFLFFIPVIIVSALLGGRGPGVFATLASTIPAAYALSPEDDPLALTRTQWTAQILFVAVNLGIAELAASLRSAVLVLGDVAEGRRMAISNLAREVQQRNQLSRIVENSSDFIAYADLEGRVQYVNEAGKALVGLQAPEETTRISDYFPVGDWSRVETEVLPIVLREGSWTGDVCFRHFETGEEIPVRYNVFTLPNVDGRPIALGTVTSDLRRERAAEQERQILVSELAHRLKNTLAITQSIATQTLRSAPDLVTARKSLGERIQALSRAHDILLTGEHDSGAVESVVRSAVELHDPEGRVALRGPDLFVGPKAALTLALIIHELATNAAKYGALSVPQGRVHIAWVVEVDDETQRPTLALMWRELGGPPVVPPSRKGFGSKLIEIGLSGSVGGSVDLDYAPDGLKCRIVAPLTELQTEAA